MAVTGHQVASNAVLHGDHLFGRCDVYAANAGVDPNTGVVFGNDKMTGTKIGCGRANNLSFPRSQMTCWLSRDRQCPVSRKMSNLSHHVGDQCREDDSYDMYMMSATVTPIGDRCCCSAPS